MAITSVMTGRSIRAPMRARVAIGSVPVRTPVDTWDPIKAHFFSLSDFFQLAVFNDRLAGERERKKK